MDSMGQFCIHIMQHSLWLPHMLTARNVFWNCQQGIWDDLSSSDYWGYPSAETLSPGALGGGLGGMSKWRRDREASGNHSFGVQLYQNIALLWRRYWITFTNILWGLGLLWSLKKSTLLTLAPKQLDFCKALNKAMQKVRRLPLLLLAWHGVFGLKLASTSFQHVKLTMKLFHGTNTSFTMLSLVED